MVRLPLDSLKSQLPNGGRTVIVALFVAVIIDFINPCHFCSYVTYIVTYGTALVSVMRRRPSRVSICTVSQERKELQKWFAYRWKA